MDTSHSAFFCCSDKDDDFATRLYRDFEAEEIDCWKWNEDARTGRELWSEIDDAIRKQNKFLLIASKSSLSSRAVYRELERALVEQDRRGGADDHMLFAVRLDDFIFTDWDHTLKADLTKYVIADACGWDEDDASYMRVRNQLIRDIKCEATLASRE